MTDTHLQMKDAFILWKEGCETNNAEKRWSGLFRMVDDAYLNPMYNGESLPELLELAFWEALELPPAHPRRQFVTNLLFTLGTWWGYFLLTWEYIKICWLSRWLDMGFGKDPDVARAANLRIQRERLRQKFREMSDVDESVTHVP